MTQTYLSGPAPGTSRTSGIAAASVQNNKAYLGSAIANQTNLDALADIELVWAFSVAPTVGSFLKVHLLVAEDGTNYEEGSGDGTTITAPLPGCQVAAVSPAADASTHRKLFQGIPLPPYPFKCLVENGATGQTATVTLIVLTRKDQIVG
jgi:hypothetical protein